MIHCEVCDDRGLVFDGAGVWACPCEAGAGPRQPMFSPRDKKKEHPIFLPVWGQEKPRDVALSPRDKAAGAREND